MRKYVFIFILLISIFFIPSVNAEVISHQGPSYNNMYSYDPGGMTTYSYNFNQNIFSGRGAGFVNFSFSVRSANGGSTNDIAIVNAVRVHAGNGYFACNIGTVQNHNSTWHTITYSASCPVDLVNTYIYGLSFSLWIPLSQNSGAIYYNGLITYSGNPNFDTSNITSSIASSQQATVNSITGTTNAVNGVKNSVDGVKNSVDGMKNTIQDDSTTGANSSANNFFSNFSQNNHGLSGIITSPLRLIQSITSSTCTPLEFSLPFVHQNVQLPCMKAIISSNFPTFYLLFELIITGLLCYRLLINFLSQIRKLQDPEYNRIGVLQL